MHPVYSEIVFLILERVYIYSVKSISLVTIAKQVQTLPKKSNVGQLQFFFPRAFFQPNIFNDAVVFNSGLN